MILANAKRCVKRNVGGAGYRSRYLSHAKRALYHLSYAPVVIVEHWSAQVITWVTPSPGSDRHWSPGLNVKRALLLFPCLWGLVQNRSLFACITFDSSVGRAVDCSWLQTEIHRSLVQIRLEGWSFCSATFPSGACVNWAFCLLPH